MKRTVAFIVSIILTAIVLSSSSEADIFDKVLNLYNKDIIGKLRKGFSDLTAEEEYYIGRSVSAQILTRYKVHDDPQINTYINTLGRLLAWSSSRPELFGGYHFTLIEADEINAFAAPGGFIFITTGLYRSLENEEQLAAVLAHEISHVVLRHGLQAIKKSNLTEAFTLIGTEAASQQNQAQLMQLTEVFGKSIDNIVNELVVSGYSQGQEYAADEEALMITYRAGYNPDGLDQFLETLQKASEGKHSKGFSSTHPPADKRIDKVNKYVNKENLAGTTETVRTSRFSSVEFHTKNVNEESE